MNGGKMKGGSILQYFLGGNNKNGKVKRNGKNRNSRGRSSTEDVYLDRTMSKR